MCRTPTLEELDAVVIPIVTDLYLISRHLIVITFHHPNYQTPDILKISTHEFDDFRIKNVLNKRCINLH